MSERNKTLEEIATLLDNKIQEYAYEFGSYDSTTNSTEFSGAGEDYVVTLEELAEEIRKMKEPS